MSNLLENEYFPDVVSPPGETLQEVLESIGMTQAELAERTGRPTKTINKIVKGKAAITSETAIQLERVLGVPATFWNNRERDYRESLARQAERKQLAGQIDWLKQFPYRTMIKMGWIEDHPDRVSLMEEALKFFGVASPDQWQKIWSTMGTQYRQSRAFEADSAAVAAWLRKGEIEAQKIQCAPYDHEKFYRALQTVRSLTRTPPEVFVSELTAVCARAGVAVVFIQELPKIRVCGATRWLTPTKAMIQLSLRYRTDDQLWFTFYHEAGHILLHGKRDIFIEGEEDQDEKEQQADQFARDFLIPQQDYAQFFPGGPYFSKIEISQFAERIGVSPGIVVGRLQHDQRLPVTHCNDLKVHLEWAANTAV